MSGSVATSSVRVRITAPGPAACFTDCEEVRAGSCLV